MASIFCAHCVNKSLSVNPKAFGNISIQWINLLEQGVPGLCPSCGLVYSAAKIVANSPQFSNETKNIAGAICGAFLFAVGLVYLNELFS